jgi:hypothetical protein
MICYFPTLEVSFALIAGSVRASMRCSKVRYKIFPDAFPIHRLSKPAGPPPRDEPVNLRIILDFSDLFFVL